MEKIEIVEMDQGKLLRTNKYLISLTSSFGVVRSIGTLILVSCELLKESWSIFCQNSLALLQLCC